MLARRWQVPQQLHGKTKSLKVLSEDIQKQMRQAIQAVVGASTGASEPGGVEDVGEDTGAGEAGGVGDVGEDTGVGEPGGMEDVGEDTGAGEPYGEVAKEMRRGRRWDKRQRSSESNLDVLTTGAGEPGGVEAVVTEDRGAGESAGVTMEVLRGSRWGKRQRGPDVFPEVAEGVCAAAVGRVSGAGELALEVEGAAASSAPRGKRKAADVPGGSLARFMVLKRVDVRPAPVRSVRIEDIVTIEDASLYVREHAGDLPGDLRQRVWAVRADLPWKQLRKVAAAYGIRRILKMEKVMHDESTDWLRYEVRRHVVSELESLATSGRNPAAASSTEGAGIVEASVCPQGAGPWRLDKTPRSIEALVESLCQENSRFLTPFGNDFEKVPLGTRLNAGECFRRMLSLQCDVEYTSLPLGAKKLQAFALEACERERKAPEECGGWTADELAEALQRGSEAHVWLLLLLTRTGEGAASVD